MLLLSQSPIMVIFIAIDGHIMREESRYSMVTRFAIVIEQVRLLMKMISIIMINHRSNKYGANYSNISLQSILFYLFAPTLVYRIEYVRTRTIEFKKRVIFTLQFFLCFYLEYIWFRYIIPYAYSTMNVTLDKLLLIPVSGLGVWFINFTVCHAYSNMTAEIFRFKDRRFDGSFWRVESMLFFLSEWNIS